MLARYPVAGFVLVAFGISWTAGTLALSPDIVLPAALKTFFDYLAKFGPSLAGIVVVAATGGRAGVRGLFGRLLQWRVASGWYGVALAGPLVLWIMAAALFFALGDAEPSAELAGLAVFPGLFALRVFLGGGLLHGTANSTENTIKAVLPALQGEATATFLYGGLILVAALALIPSLRRSQLTPG